MEPALASASLTPDWSDASAPAFALERWFASEAPRQGIDLASSGAPPLQLRALLAFATTRERELFDDASLGYGSPGGSRELLDAVAERTSSLSSANVVVSCGAIEALHLVVSALVGPGDEVVVQWPMYGAVAGLARARGAAVVNWNLREDEGFRADLSDLAPLVNDRTRLVAITQPNAPTGSLLSEDSLRELAEILAPRGIWLLSDEVYRDFVRDTPTPPHAAERYERAISVGDVSKPFGLGGLRIGWAFTRNSILAHRLRALRDYTTLSIPTVSDILARIALAHADRILVRAQGNARANLAELADVARRKSLGFAPPPAGATAFIRVPNASTVQLRLAEQGVMVVPGALFGDPGRLRIGLAGATGPFATGVASFEAEIA